MNPIAQIFNVSQAGSPANEATFPSPERGAQSLSGLISQQQLVLRRELDGDITDATMALTYNLPKLNYTISAILQTHEAQAAIAVQLICQVDSQGVPVTPQRLEHISKLSIREKQKFLEDAREARQWCVVEKIDLNAAPTYNFLISKIREALPGLYERMIANRAGDQQPFDLMRQMLVEEPEAASA